MVIETAVTALRDKTKLSFAPELCGIEDSEMFWVSSVDSEPTGKTEADTSAPELSIAGEEMVASVLILADDVDSSMVAADNDDIKDVIVTSS